MQKEKARTVQFMLRKIEDNLCSVRLRITVSLSIMYMSAKKNIDAIHGERMCVCVCVCVQEHIAGESVSGHVSVDVGFCWVEVHVYKPLWTYVVCI
jgi:hypothetical protein